MDKNTIKGIAERKLDHMRYGSFRGGINHFLETGIINGTFLSAIEELVNECEGAKQLGKEASESCQIVRLCFESKQAVYDFVESKTPFAITASRPSKYKYVQPFSSAHAQNEVMNAIAEALINKA